MWAIKKIHDSRYGNLLIWYESALQRIVFALQKRPQHNLLFHNIDSTFFSTTKNKSRTICTTTCRYYKLLVQHNSSTNLPILHNQQPSLLRAAQFFSSTCPYFTIVRQHYSALRRITPLNLSSTQYESITTKKTNILRSKFKAGIHF